MVTATPPLIPVPRGKISLAKSATTVGPRHAKWYLRAYADNEGPDQGLRCPLTEILGTIEYINGEQIPGTDTAHAQDESEPEQNIQHLFA